MPVSRLVLDGAEIADLLHGPNGPVGRHVIERATVVQNAAKMQLEREGHVRTGVLRDNINKRLEDVDGEFGVRIIASTKSSSPTQTEYAGIIHEGSEPHDIPNAFGWGPNFGIGGRFDGKFHPGFVGCKYLTDNLYLAVA